MMALILFGQKDNKKINSGSEGPSGKGKWSDIRSSGGLVKWDVSKPLELIFVPDVLYQNILRIIRNKLDLVTT